MKKALIVVASILLLSFTALPTYAGINGNGNGQGQGNGLGNGNGNGNGHGNGNGGDNGDTQDTQAVECDLVSDNWVEDLTGVILAFNGNVNNEKSKQKFTMETADGNVLVQTAPWWFMQAQPIGLDVEVEVTVSGWWCTEVEDDVEETVLIAMSIETADGYIQLRDELGHPLWAGARAVPGCGQNPDNYVLPDYAGDEITLEGVTGEVFLDCLVNGTYPSYMLDLTGEDGDGNPVVNTLVLGPKWYLEYQRFYLAAETPVTVTGVLVEVDEETTVLLVRVIETEDSLMVFRDDAGIPNWQTTRPLVP